MTKVLFDAAVEFLNKYEVTELDEQAEQAKKARLERAIERREREKRLAEEIARNNELQRRALNPHLYRPAPTEEEQKASLEEKKRWVRSKLAEQLKVAMQAKGYFTPAVEEAWREGLREGVGIDSMPNIYDHAMTEYREEGIDYDLPNQGFTDSLDRINGFFKEWMEDFQAKVEQLGKAYDETSP
jgi:hypothetical protein